MMQRDCMVGALTAAGMSIGNRTTSEGHGVHAEEQRSHSGGDGHCWGPDPKVNMATCHISHLLERTACTCVSLNG